MEKTKKQKSKIEKSSSEQSLGIVRRSDVKRETAVAGCHDVKCHVHGNLKLRGKVFEGKVIRKFPKRIMIQLERMVYVRKYERYYKSRTKIHAHLPDCMENEIQVGDLVKVQECRPLSKIIHFAVIKKIKSGVDEK